MKSEQGGQLNSASHPAGVYLPLVEHTDTKTYKIFLATGHPATVGITTEKDDPGVCIQQTHVPFTLREENTGAVIKVIKDIFGTMLCGNIRRRNKNVFNGICMLS